MPVAVHTGDQQIIWKQVGQERKDVMLFSPAWFFVFAVIFCSVGSVSVLLMGHAANTAALHKVVNVLLLKWWRHCCVYDPLICRDILRYSCNVTFFLQSFIEKPSFRIRCRQIYRSKIHFSPADVQLCGQTWRPCTSSHESCRESKRISRYSLALPSINAKCFPCVNGVLVE